MTRRQTPHTSSTDLLLEQSQGAVAQIGVFIAEIDERLRWLDLYLHQLQPPHSGRLRIKWVNRKGVKVPCPIVWNYAKKAKLWGYRELPVARLQLRGKRNREFNANAKQVGEILVLAQELLMKRSENVRRLHDLQHTARFLHMAHGARLARIDAMLDELDLEHADWVSGAPAEWSDEHEPSPNE